MNRSQERRARRQQAVTRQKLDGIERAIAEWKAEPPDGILPWAHRAYLASMLSVRDDVREKLGMSRIGDADRRA
jgi:hypothetical protein